MASPLKNIYVQLLPVIRTGLQGDKGKVLLVKWTHGNFLHRFTGMIRPTEFKAETPPTTENLREIAKSLIPKGITSKIKSLELMAILEFTDPPACDEYVFVVTLDKDDRQNSGTEETIEFEKSPCFWFPLDKIPFHEMPADDALWYPQVLHEGKLLRGSFTFGSWAEKNIQSYWVKEVDRF